MQKFSELNEKQWLKVQKELDYMAQNGNTSLVLNILTSGEVLEELKVR
jgi:hypothetical protein